MKKVLMKRVLPIAGAVLMMASLSLTAFADGYTPVAGAANAAGNPTFQKALILDENANVPNVTFEYSIAAGEAKAAVPGTSMEIISPSAATGVTGTPSIANVVYAPGDATVTTAEGVTIDSGEKAALKTATIDFTGVTFAEPGIYRYLITETSAGQQGISYDTQAANAGQKTRVLDVYVTDNNGALAVSGYVLHETADDVEISGDYGSDGQETKSLGFVNEMTTYDLTVSKAVAGNQASKDKYFKFTVAITNAGANAVLDVDIANAEAAPAKTVATVYEAAAMTAANGVDDNATIAGQQWVCGADGSVTKDVYLKHGQSIVIKGLAAGAGYTVTELPEDYKSSAEGGVITLAANNPSDDAVNGMEADGTAAFTNTRGGVVPTGVVLSAIPGIALIGVAGTGIVVLARKNKKDEDEA